jgi:hypothetical protein
LRLEVLCGEAIRHTLGDAGDVSLLMATFKLIGTANRFSVRRRLIGSRASTSACPMVDSNLPLPVLAVSPGPTGVRSQASGVFDPGVPVLAVSPDPTGVRSQASGVFDPGVPVLAVSPGPTGVRSQASGVFDPGVPVLAVSPTRRVAR